MSLWMVRRKDFPLQGGFESKTKRKKSEKPRNDRVGGQRERGGGKQGGPRNLIRSQALAARKGSVLNGGGGFKGLEVETPWNPRETCQEARKVSHGGEKRESSGNFLWSFLRSFN